MKATVDKTAGSLAQVKEVAPNYEFSLYSLLLRTCSLKKKSQFHLRISLIEAITNIDFIKYSPLVIVWEIFCVGKWEIQVFLLHTKV